MLRAVAAAGAREMRSQPWRGLVSLAPMALALACGGSEPVTSPGPGGAAGGAGTGGGGAAPDASRCPGKAGPKMVDVGLFCIDSTEVTQAQYQQFLDAQPSVADQPPECSWNKSFVPASGVWCPAGTWAPEKRPNHPAVCVDWCDAHTYCRWAGKRLCGKIGGGPTPYSQRDDPMSSQWEHACSSGGVYPTVYGKVFDGRACNGDARAGCMKGGYCDAVEVGSLTTCQSPVPSFGGVFDLSGNVFEWEDSCGSDKGAADACLRRGGDFRSEDQTMLCNTSGALGNTRDYQDIGIGFRCCGP
jgi:formylglycine-generating enzyme required for sulfatase activity